MDANIRQILTIANQSEDVEEGTKLIIEAFSLLQQAFTKANQGDDGIDVCGSDLYVQCAEILYKVGQFQISQECLRMYFNGKPLTNQFLCRAYLCQAQLLTPQSAEAANNFETAVVYLLKAINFAKDKPRYYFIVYNASVLYWQMARPFLRQGHRGLLHPSLQQVVKSLEHIKDTDYVWRATLMIALIESLVDAGCMKEASTIAQSASQFTLKNSPVMFKDVFTLQIKYKLVDMGILSKEINKMPKYTAFFKLQKIKAMLGDKPSPEAIRELNLVVNSISGRPPSSRVKTAATDGGKKQKMQHQDSISEEDRPFLLIEVARICVQVNQVSSAKYCLNALKGSDVTHSSILVEIEFLECEMMVKELGDKQEAYTKTAVEVRLAAIKRMEQALQNAVRSGNANVVQGACATQWNLCLPLLQRNLRKHVRRPLTAVALALENISSLEVMLRCQVHTELAKCEEAVEQIEAAVKHVDKALKLDDSGFYHERLNTMLHRLQLSTQLYQTPDRPEDVAAIIIEQARKSSESGSVRMKRSLLVRAGLALAPDAFQYVLDSENQMKAFDAFNSPRHKARTKVMGGTKGLVSAVLVLGAKAQQWKTCVSKAPGHLKRLGDENDRERARLWVDLTKTARQQQVWDVCRVAARFCLLYDDARWKVNPKVPFEPETPSKKRDSVQGLPVPNTGDSTVSDKRSPNTQDKLPDSSIHDADLLRFLAEVHFINGEALIHLLRTENLKLNESPTPPVDNRQRPKGHDFKKPEEEEDWKDYTDWIHLLNKKATDAFLRAIELGIELEEQWIICSGAAYLWNYNNHVLAAFRHSELVPTFERVLFGMKQIGHSCEAALLVRICDVIAKGLLKPWIPKKPPTDGTVVAQTAATTAATKDTSRKKTAPKGTGTAPGTTQGLMVDPEGLGDLTKALEFCEYGLEVTNGEKKGDVIQTAIRHQLLSTWAQLKQMMQQQISPSFGVDNEKLPDQRDMTKALVMLEMLSLNRNDMMPFTVPEISEVCDVVEECNWNDAAVELEVWTRLAQLSRLQKNHSLVVRCAKKALSLEGSAVKRESGKSNHDKLHKKTVALEMLAYTSCVLGESLMDTCAANPPARRQAMHSFVDSGLFAERAKNFALVMTASRRWWNAALPLIPSPLERELLRQPLELLLKCILHTAASVQAQEEAEETVEDDTKTVKVIEGGDTNEDKQTQKQSIGVSLGDPSDDRTLRAAMYGVLFQTYADKGEWEEGLVVMDRALHHMPRTKHRLLLFKHRVIVKAKLGKNVQMDIAKFRDESEDYVSHMWHRVSLCSKNTMEQLLAFQHAIEALYSDDTKWQKFEYLLELSTWMYSNEFAINDTVNVIEWGCDILLNLKFEEVKVEVEKVKGGKKGKASKPPTRGQPTPKAGKNTPAKTPKRATDSKQEKKKKVEDKKEEPEEVVPVERTAIIGLEADNLNLKLEDLQSTRQLEGLIRSHVMMAIVSGVGSKKHSEYCQLAYGYVMRLWKIALTSAGITLKKMPKLDLVEDGKKTADPKKKGTPAAPVAPEKTKIKRKGPLDEMPFSTVDWSTYDVPEEIKQAFLYDKTDCGINKQNITCAAMTVYYLLKLSDFLCDCALNNLSLPVLSLAGVITQVLLKSNSWTQLINIKQIIICYELHLVSSANYWEGLIDNKFLTADEQVLSRQGLELNRIHKEVAKREEKRIREANEAANGQFRQVNSGNSMKSKSTEASVERGPVTLHGRKVGGVNMSEIWTKKAKLLLKLGHYQASRTLLKEALTVAEYNKDHVLVSEINHTYADLAIREGNTGQALQLLRKAQEIGGDELFWQENISLVVDTLIFHQDPSPEDAQSVAKIVKKANNCLESLSATRPTKKATIGLMTAELTARSALLRINKKVSLVSTQLQKLEKAEKIMQDLGFHRQLAFIHMSHADILMDMAKSSKNQKHQYLLSAINLMQQSYCNLATLSSEISLMETDKKVSLPILRETMNVQLHLVKILLDTAKISAEEDRVTKEREAAKDSLQRIVEGYVGRSEHDLTSNEKIWEEERSTLLLRASTILNSMHENIPQNHVLRAKWLFLIGRSLHLLADNKSPYLPDIIWNINKVLPDDYLRELGTQSNMSVVKEVEVHSDEDIEEEPTPLYSANHEIKLNEEARTVIRDSDNANRLLSQATEVLAQCIKLSLQLQATNIVSEASIEIVECCGQSDPQTSAIYLSLHQSAESVIKMKQLVMKAVSDPTTSKFAALIHQNNWLSENFVSTGLHESTVRKEALESLKTNFIAWKRLQLASNHLDLLKDLPSFYNIVILQHSPCHNMLYCAILDKPKPGTGTVDDRRKGKDKSLASNQPSKFYVTRTNVDKNSYDEIMDKHEDYQQRLMSFLLQSEYQRSQLALRQKMLQKLSNDSAQLTISATTLEEQAMEEMKLQEKFNEILDDMEKYLSPVTSYIKSKLIDPINEQAKKQLESGQPLAELAQEFVVILAENNLQQLPLEALQCLQTPHVDSISRDFSLQLLHQRYYVDPEEEALRQERKKEELKNSPKTPKAAGKDAGKRGGATPGGKVVPLNRELTPECLAVDTNSVHYIVDPQNDCSETEQYRPIEIFEQVKQMYGQSFTSRWSGCYGTDEYPSIGQWEDNIKDCSAFIFYGMEKFIAQFPPSKLAALNLEDCQLALLLDKSQTNKSFRHQSKVDVDKTNTLLSIERPLQTAMLLSLSGSNTVCLNQWPTTPEDNATKLQQIMESILEEGMLLGPAIRKIINPNLIKPEPIPVEVPATPAGKDKGKDDLKTKGGKAGTKTPASRNNKSISVEDPTPVVETPTVEEVDDVITPDVIEKVDEVETKLDSSWCNMIVFGLPNLMVT